VISRVVRKYVVGLPAGDYVVICPERVMTHDNTDPVISMYVPVVVPCAFQEHWDTHLLTKGPTRRDGKPGSTDSALRKCTTPDTPSSR